MKKLFTLITVLIFVLTLSACKGDSDFSDDKITIWAWDPNFNISIMNKAKEIYGGDVEIEIVEMAKGDLETKLHSSLSTEGDLPDIVLIEDYMAPKYLSSYPGKFADLTDSIDHTKFIPGKVQIGTYEDKQYSVPFDSGVSGMYIRNDLVTNADVAAANIAGVSTFEEFVAAEITWDDFIAVGQAYTARTGEAFMANNFADGGLFRTILNSTQTWYTDNDGNFDFVGNAGIEEASRVYKAIYDAEVDYNGTSTEIFKAATDWATWVDPLADGGSATVTTGVWITGTVKSNADNSGNWTVMKTPKANISGAVNYSNLGGSSWYVLADGDVEESTDFLKAIYQENQGDFYDKILVENGALGSLLSAKTSDAYQANDPYFTNDKVWADFATWSALIPAIDYGAYTYEADEAIMNAMPGYLDGSKNLATFLGEAETAAESKVQ
jgi:lactose/L-arabinose transport system substrate-binding protein